MVVNFIHKEPNQECFEILKSTIVKDKELKKYRIVKDTLLQKLPEIIVNEVLGFLGEQGEFREVTLKMIKEGSLVLEY